MPDGKSPTDSPLILRKKNRNGLWESDQGPDCFGKKSLWWVNSRHDIILASATNGSSEQNNKTKNETQHKTA